MAKKLKLNIGAKKSAPSEDAGGSAESLADGKLGKVIKDSAQEIWLAGLGAYSLWGFVRAIFDPLHRGDHPAGIAERLQLLADN